MAYPSDLTRTIVLKMRRDTVVLLVAVTATTVALSSAIHSRPARQTAVSQQHWTGQLADVAPAEAPRADVEHLTSASLVVPTSELALPQVPVRALVRLRGCDGQICAPRVPTPVRRPETASAHRAGPRHAPPSLMSRLNPLNHLPDVTRISRPFAVAGDTVSGWFRRF